MKKKIYNLGIDEEDVVQVEEIYVGEVKDHGRSTYRAYLTWNSLVADTLNYLQAMYVGWIDSVQAGSGEAEEVLQLYNALEAARIEEDLADVDLDACIDAFNGWMQERGYDLVMVTYENTPVNTLKKHEHPLGRTIFLTEVEEDGEETIFIYVNRDEAEEEVLDQIGGWIDTLAAKNITQYDPMHVGLYDDYLALVNAYHTQNYGASIAAYRRLVDDMVTAHLDPRFRVDIHEVDLRD